MDAVQYPRAAPDIQEDPEAIEVPVVDDPAANEQNGDPVPPPAAQGELEVISLVSYCCLPLII